MVKNNDRKNRLVSASTLLQNSGKKNQGSFGFSLKLAKRHDFHRSIEKSIERKKWCGINRKQPEV